MTLRTAFLLVLVLFLCGCADDKAINSAFFQGQTSWFRFEGNALVPVNGFESEPALAWKPRFRAQFVTDTCVVPSDKTTAALAVSGLGLLLASDSEGVLKTQVPGSALDLTAYRTGALFLHDNKVFFQLYREPGAVLPGGDGLAAVSLGWWGADQARVAFYPVQTQVADPSRQAVSLRYQAGAVDILWKKLQGNAWSWGSTRLVLANGSESSLPLSVWDHSVNAEDSPPILNSLKEKLSSRLGEDLGARILITPAQGSSFGIAWPEKTGPLSVCAAVGSLSILLAENGIAAIGQADDVKIYRLPDLGAAGKYTHAVALEHGFVLTWEMSWRGYTGPAGILYIPYALLKS